MCAILDLVSLVVPPLTNSLEAIWDDKSPFSVLPRANGAGRSVNDFRRGSPSSSKLTPYLGRASPVVGQQPSTHVTTKTGVRTLQEIEAEMLVAASHSRAAARRHQQQQQLLQQEEENLQIRQQQHQDLQRQQILQYQQEQQHQLQIQRTLQQQHPREPLLHQTPPPRTLPVASQSPRFHEHQRQILLLQQQQELQQQQRLLELQEQLRSEEIERHMERQRIIQMNMQKTHSPHRRQSSGPTTVELQAVHTFNQRSDSPAIGHGPFSMSSQESMQYVPQSIQLQQRLSEMVQVEFMRDMQGVSTQAEQESLRMEAMKKIVEAEKMEEKRRRKAMKIAHMVSTLP
jgi:DNA topoisomerase 2-associated protein PAT1